MVTAFTPDANYCSERPQVPNRLVRVRIGSHCPSLADFISLLSAVLHMQPDQIDYYSTHSLEQCKRTDRRHVEAETSGVAALHECYRQLGVRRVLLDPANPSDPFSEATREFRMRDKITNLTLIPAHLSDIVRLYAVHERAGGVYIDNDVFVLSERFGAFRRCPFVLSSGQARRSIAVVA